MKRTALTDVEMSNYFSKYIELVPEEKPLLEALSYSLGILEQSLANVSDQKFEYRYASDKWSIKQVLAHLIDTERIFNYRALRFARQDNTPLQGYDHNVYVEYSRANDRTSASLLEELRTVRASTIALFGSIDSKDMLLTGTANDVQVSVRALGFVQAGHMIHHHHILLTKYL